MFLEIIFLIVVFLVAVITGSMVFYLVSMGFLLICLPDIIALNSAPYVPTLKKNSDTMMKLAEIKPGTKVYDLGAGDGRLIERAAEKGAEAKGYEISLALFLFSWVKRIFLGRKGRVLWGNIWNKDISDADVVLCFLMPKAMARFERNKFNTMKKGSRLVSNIFPLPNTKEDKKENNVYMYIRK